MGIISDNVLKLKMVLPMLPRMIATTLCLLVMVRAQCPEDAPCTPKNDCESYKEDLNMLKGSKVSIRSCYL